LGIHLIFAGFISTIVLVTQSSQEMVCTQATQECFICIWNDIPIWAKVLLLVVLVGTAVLGGWYAGVIAAAYWGWGLAGAYLAGATAASFLGYETMGKFFDYDSAIWNVEHGSGIDAVEDMYNAISPVPNVIADTTGMKLPGSKSSSGLVDQAVQAAQNHNNYIEDTWRKASEDE